MKKIIAISLLSLHLFSLTVCFIVHFIAVYHSDRFFEKQTSRGLYNKEDLTEVKIPVNMPGVADCTGYEDMFGEVRFANAAYNYVKIRITSKAIYLLCVPNYSTTRLCGQNIIDARKMPDIPVNKKNHVSFDGAFNLSVFNYRGIRYYFFIPELRMKIMPSSMVKSSINYSLSNPGQPPEQFYTFS